MLMRCECIVMSKHATQCNNVATMQCTECKDRLCGGCAKNHHAHVGKSEKLK